VVAGYVGEARDADCGSDAAILGFPPLWHVSAVSETNFDGEIQSGAVGAGLTSRNDLTNDRQRKVLFPQVSRSRFLEIAGFPWHKQGF
jgi:hypothetical protein